MQTTANGYALKSTRRRRVLLAFAAIVALIISPAVGYYLVFVQPGEDWFVRVNGQEIKRSVLVQLLRAEQIESSLGGAPFEFASRAFALAGELTADEVLRQQADAFGGAAADDAVDLALRQLLAPAAPDGDSNALEEVEFRELLRTYLDRRRLSEETLRRQVSAEIVRAQATVLLAATVARVQPHVRLHRILTANQVSAEFVLQRANDGAPFEQLSVDYSLTRGDGDLGWLPYGALPEHVADYLWESEPLLLSPPVAEQDGTFALYAVSARDPSRAVDATNMSVIEQRVFDDWINESINDQDIEVRLDSNMLTWLSEQLAQTRLL